MIDATLYVHPSGATWQEAHWFEASSLEGTAPQYRVVDIRDGTDQPMPWMVYVMPNRPME